MNIPAFWLASAGLITVVAGCQSQPPSRWVRVPVNGDLVLEVDTASVDRHVGSVTAWFRLSVGEPTSDGKPFYHFERLEFECPGLRSRLVDTARANGEDFIELSGQRLDTTVTAWKAYPPGSAGGRAASQVCRRLTSD